MHPKLIALAADLGLRSQPFALCTVVRRESPSSAQLGDSAVVTASGEFHGWLGGSCTRPVAVREALAAIEAGEPRIVALSPHPERDRRPHVRPVLIACHSGGSVDLFIEPVLPAPRLLVFGLSPAAYAVVRIAKVIGFSTALVDPDASPASYPEADRVLPSLGPSDDGWLAPADRSPLFAVVATLGERDEEALIEALRLEPAYVGMVASRKRLAQVRSRLLGRGVSPVLLDRIRSPAGLDIGAVLPEEIALSVLAEIVQVRRTGAGGAGEETIAAPEPSRYAIDPVCHMEVDMATARHKAEVGGETYYFCCGACREQFLASQEPQVFTR